MDLSSNITMSSLITTSRIGLLVALSISASACGNIQTVKSFSTPYEQPAAGERARIRVVSDGMVRAVPASACEDWRLPGAGVMVVPTKGFANMNGRKLDMPNGLLVKAASSAPTAMSELYVPAGVPLTLDYLSQGNTRHRCSVKKTFVPESGADYEAVFVEYGDKCLIGVNKLLPSGGIDTQSALDVSDAKLCRVTDNL
jgi:hypothetical protein